MGRALGGYGHIRGRTLFYADAITDFLGPEASELSRCGRSQSIARARGQQIDPELAEGYAVDFRELHFKHHLTIMSSRDLEGIQNLRGIEPRHLSQVFSYARILDVSCQD